MSTPIPGTGPPAAGQAPARSPQGALQHDDRLRPIPPRLPTPGPPHSATAFGLQSSPATCRATRPPERSRPRFASSRSSPTMPPRSASSLTPRWRSSVVSAGSSPWRSACAKANSWPFSGATSTSIEANSPSTTAAARPRYAHGCNPPCGQKHPGWCPDKIRTNPERGETKSDASHRTIGMPDELTRLLRAIAPARPQPGSKRATKWQDGDWVFTNTDRRAPEQHQRLPPLEGPHQGRRRPRRQAPRRPPHRRHHPAAPGGLRARGDRHDGLVHRRDDAGLPAHHRSGPQGRRRQGRRLHLGRRTQSRPDMRSAAAVRSPCRTDSSTGLYTGRT